MKNQMNLENDAKSEEAEASAKYCFKNGARFLRESLGLDQVIYNYNKTWI